MQSTYSVSTSRHSDKSAGTACVHTSTAQMAQHTAENACMLSYLDGIGDAKQRVDAVHVLGQHIQAQREERGHRGVARVRPLRHRAARLPLDILCASNDNTSSLPVGQGLLINSLKIMCDYPIALCYSEGWTGDLGLRRC